MSESEATPYVSFVTWGRNDGYTADYLARMAKALTCLVRQLEAAALASEIVVSEWNPPPERPLLVDSLDLPRTSSHVAIRGVVSDPHHHARLKGAAEHGMHSGEAWNVGIRRARGQYIVPKASDTFLSRETIDRIARRDLAPDTRTASIDTTSWCRRSCGGSTARPSSRRWKHCPPSATRTSSSNRTGICATCTPMPAATSC
jgi:hypothetical protein